MSEPITIHVPPEQRKKTTLASNLYYDTIEIYENRVVGLLNAQQKMAWYYEDYIGVDTVAATLNSQFAQVIFLTGINSQNRVVGADLMAVQNFQAMNDTNRILFCSGMFSFGKTNEFTNCVAVKIKTAFEAYKKNKKDSETEHPLSTADEIKKFKNLFDEGVITNEEFEQKKRQLLGI